MKMQRLEISKSFPRIQDTLLNTLQLDRLVSTRKMILLAAIDKKAQFSNIYPLLKLLIFHAGKRYGTVLGFILLCLALVSFINPSLLRDSTQRIVSFDKEFTPECTIHIRHFRTTKAFRGEDFVLRVNIDREVIYPAK